VITELPRSRRMKAKAYLHTFVQAAGSSVLSNSSILSRHMSICKALRNRRQLEIFLGNLNERSLNFGCISSPEIPRRMPPHSIVGHVVRCCGLTLQQQAVHLNRNHHLHRNRPSPRLILYAIQYTPLCA